MGLICTYALEHVAQLKLNIVGKIEISFASEDEPALIGLL